MAYASFHVSCHSSVGNRNILTCQSPVPNALVLVLRRRECIVDCTNNCRVGIRVSELAEVGLTAIRPSIKQERGKRWLITVNSKKRSVTCRLWTFSAAPE